MIIVKYDLISNKLLLKTKMKDTKCKQCFTVRVVEYFIFKLSDFERICQT